jgi:uncharacterized membrane protein
MSSRDREYWNCAPEEATDKVLAALRGAGGTVLRSPFDETKERLCRRRLQELARCL